MNIGELDAASTVRECWAAAVARSGAAPFLLTDDGAVTYTEMDHWSAAVAGRLRHAGIGVGSRVATALPNSARYVALILAAGRLGAVLVPVDPELTDREFLALVQHSGATHLIGEPRRAASLSALDLNATPLDAETLTARPPVDAAPPSLPDVHLGGDDPWSIIYTSGSTGQPRGAVIPQRTFGVTGAAIAEAGGYTESDIVLSVLPLHHLSVTVMSIAAAVVKGIPCALARRFSRSGFFDFVRRTGATVTITVPTVVEMLLTREPCDDDRDHPLRLVLTHRRLEAFEHRYGAQVRALWGMTETGGMGCMQRAGDTRPDTVGIPYPPEAELILVDQAGERVGAGDVGELWFRHRAAMLGYHGEEPLNEGWIRSGDLFVESGDGSYRYVGRSKNMIKRGGENISLEEIERVLYEHHAVDEVVVVAVPDPIYVEEACAVVVWHDAEPKVTELRAYCRDRLAAWKEPRYVLTWQGYLPELSNHKVDRRAVRGAVDLSAADDNRATR